MKPTIAIAIALLLTACIEPDEKLNSEPNNANNSNNANNGSNNANNTSNNANNGGGDIDPTDYDQSCTFEDDCTLMNSGDPCACHVCPDAAIASTAMADLQDDIAAAMCGEISCPAIGCGEDLLAHCNSGTCEVRTAKYVQADDFDRACSEATDCVGVFEGEICAPCQGCANTAINVADLEAYQAEFDVSCQRNLDCACAEPEVFCNEGRCELVTD